MLLFGCLARPGAIYCSQIAVVQRKTNMRHATASSELNGVHQILVILKAIPRSLGPWYLRLIHVLRDSLNIVTVLTWLSNTGRRL